MQRKNGTSRRDVLKKGALIAGLSQVSIFRPNIARAADKIRIGLMLPFSGTFAPLGTNNANGFKLALAENGSRLGGREYELIVLDDEADPSKAIENANKLALRDKVDVIVGTVHSGVQMGIQRVARETGVISIISNAGLEAATGTLCAPNVFRSSYASSQATMPLGPEMLKRGHKKAVWISWKYASGDEMFKGFQDGYVPAGGQIAKYYGIPFPGTEFQAIFTEVAAMKPDAVVAYFSAGAAIKFFKDYAAAGMKGKIPVYGPGFLTDGILDAVDNDAEGVLTTLYYGDGLDLPQNIKFRAAYTKAYGGNPDVYSVHGYDAGLLLIHGANAVNGDFNAKQALIKAMETATIDSPRGKWTVSKSHNPIIDIYLREVQGNQNKVIGVAASAVTDPGTGCKMG